MIQVNNITAGYGRKIVLKDINISFEKGFIYGVLGPNGCGKTTLLRVLSGIIKPKTGNVLLNDKPINEMDYKKIARFVAVVLPEESLIFDFKVYDIVSMGRTPYLKWNQFEDKNTDIDSILRETDLYSRKNDFYNELSSGERQLVEIARGLAQDPEYLLLDEPTTHLDLLHQIKIMSLIEKLNREKHLTVVAVMHDINLAALFCDKLIMMKSGSILTEGETNNILNKINIKNVFGVEVDVFEKGDKKQIVLETLH